MSKYAIWNKQDAVITPIGEVFTAEQWMERYPVARLDNIKVICGAGEINGSFFGTLGQMVSVYEAQGCDFSSCSTDEEKLAAIEAFEEEMSKPDETPTAEERIAAAMEYQVMATLPDVE
ncbi:MAG: hypothetical protein HFI72_05725 [Peptococcaceae bacterium]|jgi:hypothetical protein|nr:hypothetical protein [Peptococcaceae bacterium]